jgi:hypothetical protein
MVDVSFHRKCGFAFSPPQATRAEPRAKSRGRLSLGAAALIVVLASLLRWAIVAAIIYVIAGLA